MTELIPLTDVHFVHGKPDFEYDECYSCFTDRKFFYRLVNLGSRQWAFYNDTVDTIVKVRAVFQPGSCIKALERTHLHDLDATSNSQDSLAAQSQEETASMKIEHSQEATLEVEPFRTELFIEGTVTGFSIDFQTEAAPATDVTFEYRRPSMSYDKIYKCFKNNGNGLLFRLVDSNKGIWAFYNDTKTYIMTVTVDFFNPAEFKPLGQTVLSNTASEYPQGVVYALIIAPGETQPFIEGQPMTYKISYAAEPLPVKPGLSPGEVHYENGKPDPAIIPQYTRVYQCFKDNGNGLLFRLVDEENKLWAFYNDTKDYIMTANVRFPPASDVKFATNVQTMEDSERVGGIIASVRVQPLETAPFLVGAALDYELAFVAAPISANVPEEHPQYINGGPDASVGEFQEVHRCFKQHGNGLLFRLVDLVNKRWAFYNDTTDLVMTAHVAFKSGAKVRALGKTLMETDNSGDVVYSLSIPPLATMPFVEGEVAIYSTKFSACKMPLVDSSVASEVTDTQGTASLPQSSSTVDQTQIESNISGESISAKSIPVTAHTAAEEEKARPI